MLEAACAGDKANTDAAARARAAMARLVGRARLIRHPSSAKCTNSGEQILVPKRRSHALFTARRMRAVLSALQGPRLTPHEHVTALGGQARPRAGLEHPGVLTVGKEPERVRRERRARGNMLEPVNGA